MDPYKARQIIETWTREQFGKLLEVREVTVIRRAAGRVWSGELYCIMKEGELLVGTVGIDEQGKLTRTINADDLANTLAEVRLSESRASMPDTAVADNDFSDDSWEDDFSGIGLDEGGGDDLDGVFDSLDSSAVQDQANALIASGDHEKLLQAREILPQLLSIPQNRGRVLQQMGELELLLGELDLGVNYLEAAAREFADVAAVDDLDHVAEITLRVIGPDKFETSPVKQLLERARARMRPVEKIDHAPLFVGMDQEAMFHLMGASSIINIEHGEELLVEGTPATHAFVVRSGVLTIRIESPDGSERVVRSCFPGDFIGESSVIEKPGATCTATVKGECLTSLWMFEGARLRELLAEFPEIGVRIDSARTLHRLDSFLSQHEATETLDTAVRDQLLSSISGISRYGPGEILNKAGEVPQGVYLVASGRVEYRVPNRPPRVYRVDSFAGLRDTLHELPLEGEFITASDCLLVRFDTKRLKEIAADASTAVVAVLEKME